MESVRALKRVMDSATGLSHEEGEVFKVAKGRVQELVELGIVVRSTAESDVNVEHAIEVDKDVVFAPEKIEVGVEKEKVIIEDKKEKKVIKK